MKSVAKILIMASLVIVGCAETEEQKRASLQSDIEATAKLRNERQEYEQKNARYQKAYETKIQIEQIQQKMSR